MALAYTSTTDLDGSLSSNFVVSYLIGPSYIHNDDLEISSNITVVNKPPVYTSNLDNFNLSSTIHGGQYVVNTSYTSSVDNQNFVSNVGGIYLVGSTYTSSVDNQNFVSNLGGVHIGSGYVDSQTLSTLDGTKNQTVAYIYNLDMGNLGIESLVGSKETKKVPVTVAFSSAIPYIRLNVPSNAPFLKQVFVE